MHWMIRSGPHNRLPLMFVLLVGIGLFACTGIQPAPLPGTAVTPVPGSDLKAWHEGLQAFEDGDFEKARALFEVLTENAEPEGLGRRAFFALAATRLVLAQTPEEFSEALTTWECWNEQFPQALAEEDPRMLTPFLQQLTPPGSLGSQPRENQPPVKKVIVATSTSCKELLQAKDKELEKIKARLDTKEKEARRLKHQIESLEAIHLRFQERKQGVSSP